MKLPGQTQENVTTISQIITDALADMRADCWVVPGSFDHPLSAIDKAVPAWNCAGTLYPLPPGWRWDASNKRFYHDGHASFVKYDKDNYRWVIVDSESGDVVYKCSNAIKAFIIAGYQNTKPTSKGVE